MKQESRVRSRRAAVLSVGLLVVPGLALSQAFWSDDGTVLPGAPSWLSEKATLPPYDPPRMPDGVPDLQGNWSGGSSDGTSYLEAHDYLDPTTPAQESFISDPPDGRVPYTAWGMEKRNEILAGLAQGWSEPEQAGDEVTRLYSSPFAYCLDFMPMFSFENIEIIQRPGAVIMLGGTSYRVIPTDGRASMKEDAKFWFGSSRGHWDGDTLVVEVNNLNGLGWFDMSGLYYSENTRMVERWTRVHDDTIDYEVTIEDPSIYTQPWRMNFPKRRPGTGPNTRGSRVPSAVTLNAPRFENPYAGERWEAACYEGNGPSERALRGLGFQWFRGVHPPD